MKALSWKWFSDADSNQMQTDCGSLGKLKVGALVYSGGSQINEASADQNTPNTVALKNYSEDVSNIKLDDFNTFLGFNPNYTFDQFTRKYGKPTKIDRDSKYDFNAAYWDKSASYGVTDHVMTVFYDRRQTKSCQYSSIKLLRMIRLEVI
jgi:hypothetical protein